MVGVENYCAVLDCVAGVCFVCADDFEIEVENSWPRIRTDFTDKTISFSESVRIPDDPWQMKFLDGT